MWILLVICLCVNELKGQITDAEYALMPPVFHYDDYDRCMLLGTDAVYCNVVIELTPINPENTSKIWNIIEEVSRSKKNVKHYKLRYGVCIWQSCSHFFQNRDLNNVTELKAGLIDCYTAQLANIEVKVHIRDLYVQRGGVVKELNAYNIVLILCLVGVGILLIFGTVYEAFLRNKSKDVYDQKVKNSHFVEFISCFSIPKNWKLLFAPFKSEDATAFRGIQGVRFFSMYSILIAHTSVFLGFTGIINTRTLETSFGDIKRAVVQNNTHACQAFLVISGWLLANQYFQIFETYRTPRLKYLFRSFINRYLRLTPTLVVLIVVVVNTDNRPDTGPFAFKTIEYIYACRKNWWANLLYIHNYYDVKNMCLLHTWYLATDMQLYLLSLIILGIIWKYKKFTRTILGICLCISIMTPIVYNYANDYDIMITNPEDIGGNLLVEMELLRKVYIPTHTNMGAYIIGIIFGYIFHVTKDKEMFTQKIHIWLWYILVISLPLIVIFGGIPFYSDNYVHNRIMAALYVGIGRNAWSFSIALCIYGLSKGIGGFIKDVLFWEPFQVLGKLCFCTYLFHVIILCSVVVKQRAPTYFDPLALLWTSLGNLLSSILLALVICLCVEMPSQSLQKLYIPQIRLKRKLSIPIIKSEP